MKAYNITNEIYRNEGISPKFIVISLRKNILPILFCLFAIFLVIFSKSNLSSAKEGLTLWATNVVPALFPFFVATELLSHTNLIEKLGKILTPIMRPLFNVPGCGAYAFIIGILSGYPIGAKIVANLREQSQCTKEEAERLLAFTNNSGPLFIIGTVGISLYCNSTIGILLFITHFLSCLTVAFLFRFWKSRKKNQCSNFSESFENSTKKNTNYKNVNFSNLGEVISSSITSATSSILMIGGFIVLFSVIISILNNSSLTFVLSRLIQPVFNFFEITDNSFSQSFITGLFEITTGIQKLSILPNKMISTNLILTSFLLGFSGISILLQVLSITSKTDVSIRSYIIGKILHGIFAMIYTYIFISIFPVFNFNL